MATSGHKGVTLVKLCEAAAFPWSNLYSITTGAGDDKVQRDVQGNFGGTPLRPTFNLSDHLMLQAGSIPKLLLSWLLFKYTVDMREASQGFDFSPTGWVAKVVMRDLLLMLIFAWGWDWLFYFSPLKARLSGLKLEKARPSTTQILRDGLWTLSATLLASAQEVLVMRHWEAIPWAPPCELPFFGTATDAVLSLPELPLLGVIHLHGLTCGFLAWTLSMFYWRIAHFWAIHRGMHPWWDRRRGLLDGDIGAFLYRWVHAHHHKSYNPTALSGISMLPVESIAYISAALIPLLFRSGCHPLIHLYTKLDLIVGAQIGHSGFDGVGGASYFHQLHHAHFECNYGDSAVPLDYWFGTFEDGSKWQRQGQPTKRSATSPSRAGPRKAGSTSPYRRQYPPREKRPVKSQSPTTK
jgi:hypothetical protein